MKHIIVFCILIFNFNQAFSQHKNFLQLNTGVGLGFPIQEYAKSNVFAAPGISTGLSADYFFGNWGFGFQYNYNTNPGVTKFFDYISDRFLDQPLKLKAGDWKTRSFMTGPVFKFRKSRFEIDLLGRIGFNSTSIPEFEYIRTVASQDFMAYRFESFMRSEFYLAYNLETRLGLRLNDWLALSSSISFFRTQPSDAVSFAYTYRNVADLNRNGLIDDSEFLDSEIQNVAEAIPLTLVNVRLGFNFSFYRKKNRVAADQARRKKQERIIIPHHDIESHAKNNNTDATHSADEIETVQIKGTPEHQPASIQSEAIPADLRDIGDYNFEESSDRMQNAADVSEHNEQDSMELLAREESDKFEHTVGNNFDLEAATLLFKSGEAYFEANDFVNSYVVFNRLKETAAFPMAKYMLSLSLAEMGLCEKSLSYFDEFTKNYRGTDLRTLEVLFNSHLTRCKNIKVDNEDEVLLLKPLENSDNISKIEYKIQFLAMRKNSYEFPQVEKIGKKVVTEYVEELKLYRYVLPHYDSLEDALKDLNSVRKLGFNNAFVAVYVNGERVNTIYHE